MFARIDAASLLVFRVVYGVAVVAWVLREWITGLASERYLGLAVHLSFFAMPALPDVGVIALLDGLAVLGAFIALGFHSRVSCFLVGCGFLYLFLEEMCLFQNHYYLIWLLGFALAALPVHDGLSASRALAKRPQSGTAPAWPLY